MTNEKSTANAYAIEHSAPRASNGSDVLTAISDTGEVSQTIADAIAKVAPVLLEGHQRQWALEDQCRMGKGNSADARIAELKRKIDDLNDRRIGLISSLDLIVSQEIPHDPSLSPTMLTIGQALDRVLVAAVRDVNVANVDTACLLRDQLEAWQTDVVSIGLGRRRPPRDPMRKHYLVGADDNNS